jgi:hypothetical protein
LSFFTLLAGPTWPLSGNHSEGPGYEPDPGCPDPGCLFHLPSDPEERHECGAQYPAKLKELVDRLAVLDAGAFQTWNYTAGYDKCSSPADVARAHRNFVAPPCEKGPPDKIDEEEEEEEDRLAAREA